MPKRVHFEIQPRTPFHIKVKDASGKWWDMVVDATILDVSEDGTKDGKPKFDLRIHWNADWFPLDDVVAKSDDN